MKETSAPASLFSYGSCCRLLPSHRRVLIIRYKRKELDPPIGKKKTMNAEPITNLNIGSSLKRVVIGGPTSMLRVILGSAIHEKGILRPLTSISHQFSQCARADTRGRDRRREVGMRQTVGPIGHSWTHFPPVSFY